ncbi:CocE/NonD family hydrolase [Verminephrobacter aporrectodeae subsp. tuberculatae]|uniref:CocE/NonD family hydrolase n=1 Tax=Verminephrobacter aporrectodeae TaxID=1110389 RepID=UPI0022439102|nr:CocE/NonD family hydrolase [Verminephrobacter aporrectodeae]MCW8207733.1 CocE/NonD family hydrolase [Verminephrobacter aporrectodeae subsp. tuberculatae]
MTGHAFTVLENTWISLRDGTRLAARIWLPDTEDRLPAVLEYLPYRKRGGTHARDESTYPVFAAAGIVGVRVDIRGSGESDGVIDGEYTPRELSDAGEVIAWIARQPWSNGSVGMMGISWGGFNCLQVAALRPPALRAVISIASTVDRYNDDIHYKNGCHLSAQLGWAATMLAYQSRAPDPALVGARWRAMWLERLEAEPFFLEEWLTHQRRDGFWKHGSICEDFGAVQVPALVIAGWADGYRNTPFKAALGLGDRAKSVVGPWIHKYPHFAWPKPRWDFHGEAIAWWKQWLCKEPTGVDARPQLRAYILDGPRPALRREQDPGFWVAKTLWTEPELASFGIAADGRLSAAALGQGVGKVHHRSPLATGTASGEWFTLKPDAEMAGDQRGDDAGSLVFETAPLSTAQTFLGQPRLTLDLSSDGEAANLIVRVVDVHPDGAATRVSLGAMNLTHRAGNETPVPLPRGATVRATLELDACGYRFAPGHRIRLALSTSYWPTVLPAPTDPGVTMDTATLTLAMPLLGAHERIDMPEPANPDPLPRYNARSPSETRRSVERDLTTGVTRYTIYEDSGLSEHPDHGLATRDVREEVWSITEGDPLSMSGACRWECIARREDWAVRTVTTANLACSATHWLSAGSVTAFEGDTPIFSKRYEKRIPRDLM